jgi:hypothetical protein
MCTKQNWCQRIAPLKAGPHLDKDQVRVRGRKVMDALAHVGRWRRCQRAIVECMVLVRENRSDPVEEPLPI